ncbi:MAG: hypothetical protein QOF51_1755 [Chloroflexota bacterium]|nr:hypothetical protein [Chloroflexota bacterium]
MLRGMTGVMPVYLEGGKHRVFACALEWPGWCRAGRDEASALAALAAYAPRYAPVAAEAGVAFPSEAEASFDVVERLAGTATTDFGAPDVVATADAAPLTEPKARQLGALVKASWVILDRVVAAAPAELRKGPRGGGRDRDKIAEHVLAAETAYGRKLGLRGLKQPALDDTAAIATLRGAIVATLIEAAVQASTPAGQWPPRYAARRIAWHVLDHAWEIEDRSTPAPV